MDKKKPNTLQTVFQLAEISYTDSAPKYPKFEVFSCPVGYFSSLTKAERAMKKWIKGYDSTEGIFGFMIEEYCLDLLSEYLRTTRNYLPDGSFWDVDFANEKFFGRPAEKVRFRIGDLAEEHTFDSVSLVMIGNLANSPEEAKEGLERFKNKYTDRHLIGFVADGSYYALHVNEED